MRADLTVSRLLARAKRAATTPAPTTLASALAGSVTLAMACCLGVTAAQSTVQVAIDLTHQRMHVQSNEGNFDWAISSARSGFYTPGGSFAPTHLELMHYSKKYHMSPMPHAIFFRGGYAIHGTYSTGSLGRPASHGCVRLSPSNATTLYNMVRSEGARISISGTPPATPRIYARREGAARYQRADYGDAGYGYPYEQSGGYGAGYGYGYGPATGPSFSPFFDGQ